MYLMKPLSFFLISISFLGTAVAADDAGSVETSRQHRISGVQSDSEAFPVAAPGVPTNPMVTVWMGSHRKRIDLDPFAGVCFAMRTYKVKPTERLRDNESGSRGYTTCQMGSNYQVRSADELPVKLK